MDSRLSMQKLFNPVPTFLDTNGRLLDGGKIYVGVAGGDPVTSPVDCFWDEALTIPAAQPIRTIGGLIVNGATPAPVFTGAADYSMRLADANDVQIFYSKSVFVDTSSFQPRDVDLDAIAALSTTPYGRALLTLADQGALRTATGIPNPLPLAGGTVTGGIIRAGAGAYAYWSDAALTSGRVFLTASGAADPTSQPGDIWLEKS